MTEPSNELYPGIELSWHDDRRIISYTLTSVSNDVIERWARLTEQVISEWPKDRPYLAVHDVSIPGVSIQYSLLVSFDYMNIGITKAGRQKIEEIFKLHPTFSARVAVYFNFSVSGRIGKTLMSSESSTDTRIAYRAFYNQQKALSWLVESYSDR